MSVRLRVCLRVCASCHVRGRSSDALRATHVSSSDADLLMIASVEGKPVASSSTVYALARELQFTSFNQ